MRKTLNWDEWFLSIAHTVALKSKDPHTQVGCLIVHPGTHAVRSTGYNGMIAGMTETDALWERPTKYDYVCHAESNAISLSARHGTSTEGCIAYITHFPCLPCLKLLVQSGIIQIIIPEDSVTLGALEDREKIYKLLHELYDFEISTLNFVQERRD